MSDARTRFWADHYGKLSERGEHWLDYSNERVQAQTFGVVLAALGPVAGRRCLDVGCGLGQLACALRALGAREVTGIDLTVEFILELRRTHPDQRWEAGTLDDRHLYERLGSFDAIVLVEVLQYVPVAATLRKAWNLLAPGGRLVAVVPNAECPIVARAAARFPGSYLAPSGAELALVGRELEECEAWGLQGMSFGTDQSLVPYVVSSFAAQREAVAQSERMAQPETATSPEPAPPPNRWVFAAQREHEEPASSR
jgi:2-polyprenyl-3-methyl-5-hydroxy-6-metoxy-1,4-benzoquinol methylase